MNPDFSGVWKANLPRSKLLGPQPKVPLATIFLSLGSNLGNREKNLRTAIAALPEANVRVTHVSSFYETEPVDLREQPWFLNCVVQAETEIPAKDLLRALGAI